MISSCTVSLHNLYVNFQDHYLNNLTKDQGQWCRTFAHLLFSSVIKTYLYIIIFLFIIILKSSSNKKINFFHLSHNNIRWMCLHLSKGKTSKMWTISPQAFHHISVIHFFVLPNFFLYISIIRFIQINGKKKFRAYFFDWI